MEPTIYDLARKSAAIGSFKMGFKFARFSAGLLYFLLDKDRYLAIDYFNESCYIADRRLKPVLAKSSVVADEIVPVTESLKMMIDQAETGVNDLSHRLNRFKTSVWYWLTNPFVKTKMQMGQPLQEYHQYIYASFIFTTKKVVDMGAEKAGLKMSKIIDQKLYLYQGEGKGYLVISPYAPKAVWPTSHANDNLEIERDAFLSFGFMSGMTLKMREWFKY